MELMAELTSDSHSLPASRLPEPAGEMDPLPFPSSPISLAYTADAMASHPPRNLQDHLYASFLDGSTADVALHISGSWQAVYKLHRVVLIQAVSLLHLSNFPRRAELTSLAPTGILPPSLHRRFLRIAFPPKTLTLRWS